MASTYSPLKIELIGTGEQSGIWGNTTNLNLGTALEEAITGSADVSFSSSDVTLTLTDTPNSQTGRNLRLNLTGTSGGARNLILGTDMQIKKLYLINNGLADAVTVKNTTGTGVVVPAGRSMFVFNNGTDVVETITHLNSPTFTTPNIGAATGTQLDIDNIRLDGNTISTTNTNGNLTTTANGTGYYIYSGTQAVLVPKGNNTTERPGTPVTGMLRYNTTSDEFEGYSGSSPAWKSVGGAAITNDTTTASDLYPAYLNATTGTASTVFTSNAQYLFKPSTGELKVKAPVAQNGILVNATTMTSNYTIATGTNGLSVGPFTINSGVTLTIDSGQRHLIL